MTVMCEKGEMKVMAEYLSPGVYVEEFDSGSKPMEGVGTSTAGFIGLAGEGRSKVFRSSLQTFPTLRESMVGIYPRMNLVNIVSLRTQ